MYEIRRIGVDRGKDVEVSCVVLLLFVYLQSHFLVGLNRLYLLTFGDNACT